MTDDGGLREDFARVAEWIAQYYEHPGRYRVLPDAAPGDVTASLPPEAPEHGEPFARIFADFERIIVPATTHWNHPRFFAYFATSSAPAAVAAEALAATLDVKAMLWRTSPAATELESVTMRWLGRLLALPDAWMGIIYDTASIAGFTALAAARDAKVPGIRRNGIAARALRQMRMYATEHTHSHVEKAAIALGIGQDNVVRVACDPEFRMRPDALERAIVGDVAAGMLAVAVVATIGTTSTTSIDPLAAIADVTMRHGVWLHVDAAYAGVAAILPEQRRLLDGIEHADSLVVNPHKWMFVPMDLSVLFVKNPTLLRETFSLVPEYLTTPEAATVNYMDYGLQLGRRFRALKLWFVLRRFGAAGIRERLRAHIAYAQTFASWVGADPAWEIMAPHPLSVVCFRYRGGNSKTIDADNQRLLHAVNATGELFMSHTKIGGAFALRLAIGNLRTQPSDVERAWDVLRQQAVLTVSSVA